MFFTTLLAALVACASSREAHDPFHLHVAIGRWHLMASQVADLHQIAQPGYVYDEEILDPRSLARRLREAVWFYNLERLEMCAHGRLVSLSCTPPYLPAWLSETAEEAPSFRTLAARSEDVGERILPFWQAVCDEARAAEPDAAARAQICPME